MTLLNLREGRQKIQTEPKHKRKNTAITFYKNQKINQKFAKLE